MIGSPQQWQIAVPKRHAADLHQILRSWATAHAGDSKSQARRTLRRTKAGEWAEGPLTITLRMSDWITLGTVQTMIVSVKRLNDDTGVSETIYSASATSWGPINDQATALVSIMEHQDHVRTWADEAGPEGIQKALDEFRVKKLKQVWEQKNVTGPQALIADLRPQSRQYTIALPWTPEGEPSPTMHQLAERQADWAETRVVDHAATLSISRQLGEQATIADWIQSTFAVFTNGDESEIPHLVFATEDEERAGQYSGSMTALIDEQRRQATIHEMSGVINVLNGIPSIEPLPMESKDSKQLDQPAAYAATDQRTAMLEDRLQEARDEAGALREQLETAQRERDAAYEALRRPSVQGDEQTDQDGDDGESSTLREHIDEAVESGRFGAIRILKNATRPLNRHRHPHPAPEDVIRALEQIDKLSRAYTNTPSGNIGQWRNFFSELTGWNYRHDESETTKAMEGKFRRFMDADLGERIDVYRHLTYESKGTCLQIFFDRLEHTEEFVVAYIGPHLPYATQP